jgi:hypothetical protein
MIRIINRQRYNTEAATIIGVAESACYPGDFYYWVETLYQTKKGAYFLHGRGGARSRWSHPSGDSGSCAGEDIQALAREQAYQWAENNQAGLDHFDDMIKDA